MDRIHALATADQALDALRDAAMYAEAQHGRAHGESLMHYHATLTATLTQAFDAVMQARDATRSKREQRGLLAYATAVGAAVQADTEAVVTRHAALVQQTLPQGNGAKHLMTAAVGIAKLQAGRWWDGHMRLGPLTSTAVAARDWRRFRPLPGWTPYAAIGGVVASGGITVFSVLPL